MAITDSGTAWATAVWYDTAEGYLLRSADAGQTWTEHAVPIPDLDDHIDVDIIAISSSDPLTAWVVVGPFGGDILLHTTDGGESFEPVFSTKGDIISGAEDAEGGIWIAVSGQTYFRAEDGQTFEPLLDAPVGLSVSARDEDIWMATNATYTGTIAELANTTGTDFTPMFHLSLLNPSPTCAADSHSTLRCDPLWGELQKRLPIIPNTDSGEPDSGEPADTGAPTEPTCGCRGEGAGVLLLLPLLGWRRRR